MLPSEREVIPTEYFTYRWLVVPEATQLTNQDSERAKIFTKIIRELVTAACLSGGDPSFQPASACGHQ